MKSLLVALALTPSLAHAESWFQIEAGAGVAQYETQDGRWYQQGMPVSSVSPRNLAFSIGATGAVIAHGSWGIDWHADYVNLGRVAAACACTPNDANYNPSTHVYSPNIVPSPLAYYTGNGRSQGFVLSLKPYYYWRGVRLGIEAGAYINRVDWTEDVYGWAPNYDMPTRNMHIETRYWGIVPVVGASIGDGVWSIGYRHYFTSRQHLHDEYPPLWNDINVLEVRYTF